jgi:tripartite-type tricarboxylate transporter receptor subunit TctC
VTAQNSSSRSYGLCRKLQLGETVSLKREPHAFRGRRPAAAAEVEPLVVSRSQPWSATRDLRRSRGQCYGPVQRFFSFDIRPNRVEGREEFMAASIRPRVARIAPAVLILSTFVLSTIVLSTPVLLALASASHAEDAYPARPVHILVPFPPGGAVDTVARTLADELGKRWPVNIIVDNRPGAGGTIAADATAKAAPDGYTLAVVASGHPIAPFLFRKLPYDIFRDFTPITLLGTAPNLALVRADSPVRSIADLVAAARAKPGQLSYGHSGNGTSAHLAAELFKAMAKVDIVPIPYKGGMPALNDLLGGHIPLSFNNLPEAIAMIRSGSVRALAVTTAARSPLASDVPTFEEAGGLKGYDTGVWWALLAPAGLPAEVAARINRDAADAMMTPAVRERFETLGAVPVGSTLDEIAALIRADYDKWGPVIKAAGIVPE